MKIVLYRICVLCMVVVYLDLSVHRFGSVHPKFQGKAKELRKYKRAHTTNLTVFSFDYLEFRHSNPAKKKKKVKVVVVAAKTAVNLALPAKTNPQGGAGSSGGKGASDGSAIANTLLYMSINEAVVNGGDGPPSRPPWTPSRGWRWRWSHHGSGGFDGGSHQGP